MHPLSINITFSLEENVIMDNGHFLAWNDSLKKKHLKDGCVT